MPYLQLGAVLVRTKTVAAFVRMPHLRAGMNRGTPLTKTLLRGNEIKSKNCEV